MNIQMAGIRNKEDAVERVGKKITELTEKYPLYKNDFIL